MLLLLAVTAPDKIDRSHPYGNHVRLVDNGFCVGLAWITLKPGEVATVDYGPDFDVYRVKGPGDSEWGAYSGFAGQSIPDIHHVLLHKAGVTVFRGTDDKSFNGYFIGDGSHQNHFFGTVFRDASSDSTFFDRVILGPTAKAKCESYWKQ